MGPEPNIKGRLEKLEAVTPMAASDRIREIHRVIMGKFNEDGSPLVIVRRLDP